MNEGVGIQYLRTKTRPQNKTLHQHTQIDMLSADVQTACQFVCSNGNFVLRTLNPSYWVLQNFAVLVTLFLLSHFVLYSLILIHPVHSAATRGH